MAGTHLNPPPPAAVAVIDRMRASLAELVLLVRRHRTAGCDVYACVGSEVHAGVEDAGPNTVRSLLHLALYDMAGEHGPAHVRYRLWSNKHGMWWRANARGYTRESDEAGLYTEAEAVRHVAKSAMHGDLSKVTCMVVALPPYPSPTTVEQS